MSEALSALRNTRPPEILQKLSNKAFSDKSYEQASMTRSTHQFS